MLHLTNFFMQNNLHLETNNKYTIASNILDMTLQQQKRYYYLSYTFHM